MAEPPICGDCTVFIADENAPLKALGDTVNHCPMHAAVDELLAALEAEHRERLFAEDALSPQAQQHRGTVRARDFAFFAESCDTCGAIAAARGGAS
jgi:hypothetical protein